MFAMNFYLIQLRKNSVVLYTEEDHAGRGALPEPTPHPSNPIDRFLAWLGARKGRTARFAKDLIVVVRETYYKLEQKIDPMERVFKRMRHATQLTVSYSPTLGVAVAEEKFEALLTRQKKKHTFWGGVDLVLSGGVLLLSPILVPIPGPNVFLYYPCLRLISHHLARRGVIAGLTLKDKTFQPLTELSDIETILSQQRSQLDLERIGRLARQLKLEYLPNFLERYS